MPNTTSTTSVKNNRPFARCIACNKVDKFAPIHWLALAVKDFMKAPLLSLIYGAIFSLIPGIILYVVYQSGTHLVILPATVAFTLIGPAFAVGLYDIAWEIEKNHKPTLKHSVKSMLRNPVGEWGFAILLMLAMIVWMRLAALIHVLYPHTTNPSLEEWSAFLMLGSCIGALMLTSVFAISAFTPQIMMERRVDIMTAVISSINAVKENVGAMIVWASCIIFLVLLGFITGAIGFVIVMPILSFASWHGYIAVIKHKSARGFE